MRFEASIEFNRYKLNDDGVVLNELESSMRTWDDIEAYSDDEAWVAAMVRLRTVEPNLERANVKVKRVEKPQLAARMC